MTYVQFLLVFLVPPVVVLSFLLRREGVVRARRWWWSVLSLAAIALVYTTPWDSHLLAIEAWTYPPGAVLATIGLIPVEEYTFFILQPIGAGLLLGVMSRLDIHPYRSHVPNARRGGILVGLVLTALGIWVYLDGISTYLGLILMWSGPIIIVQWAYDGSTLWSTRSRWLGPLSAATVYLWVADWIAIDLGIWQISERHTVGWDVYGLPLEEMVFFLMTNTMVVFGVILLANGVFRIPPADQSD